MKTAEKIVVATDKGHFQGELYIGPVQVLPEGLDKETPRENGDIIVGHSETGHHHVIHQPDVRLLETSDPLVCFLVAEGAYADLVHQREHDTHPTLCLSFLPSGVPSAPTGRKVVRQREMSPAGWVRAAD